jgi:hypothetical protein
MDTSELIVASLGLQDVLVESVEFNKDKLTAEIVVRQKRETARGGILRPPCVQKQDAQDA